MMIQLQYTFKEKDVGGNNLTIFRGLSPPNFRVVLHVLLEDFASKRLP